MDRLKTELQIALELLRLLDGLSVAEADNALIRARSLLPKTQIVRADSPLLLAATENELAFKSTDD
jgi:hypothetical protein